MQVYVEIRQQFSHPQVSDDALGEDASLEPPLPLTVSTRLKP